MSADGQVHKISSEIPIWSRLLLLKHASVNEQLHTCKLMYLLMPDVSAVDCSMFSKELDGVLQQVIVGAESKSGGFVMVRN